MRYGKLALLTFGGGLLLGLVAVAFGLDPLGRVASGLMALAIAALLPAAAADLWLALKARFVAAGRPAPARRRRAARPAPRSAQRRRPSPRKR